MKCERWDGDMGEGGERLYVEGSLLLLVIETTKMVKKGGKRVKREKSG